MKKLMAMLGAVAMALGLFAEVENYNISFEQADADKGKGVDLTTMTFTPDGAQWTGDAQPINAYDAENRGYTYGTGTQERRNSEFDGQDSNDHFLKLDTGNGEISCAVDAGNIFFDQTVKFTAFEEAPTLGENDKIAVWSSEDAESAKLYVSCGKVSGIETLQTNLVIALDGFDLAVWHRVTIKSLGDVYEGNVDGVPPRAGFIVYIDGQLVASDDPAAKELTDMTGALTVKASEYMAAGQLFLSFKDNDATFSSIAYQGVGAIDDIIQDAVGPAFASGDGINVHVAPVLHASVTAYVNEEPVSSGEDFTVQPGTTVKFIYKADEGYLISTSEFTKTVPDDGHSFDFTDEVNPQAIIAIVLEDWDRETACATVADTLAAIQKAEGDGVADIHVDILKDIDETEIEGNVIALPMGSSIDIAPFDGMWTLYGTEGGTIVLKTDVDAGKSVVVDVWGGTFNYAGTVAGVLKAQTFAAADTVKIVQDGQVLAQDNGYEFACDEGFEVVVTEEPDEDDYYTYSVQQKTTGPVTFTVAKDDNIDSFTVTTNGVPVVDIEDIYTVNAGAEVTVTPTAKTGYTAETVVQKVFEDGTVIALTSVVEVYEITYTFTGLDSGAVPTHENPVIYTVTNAITFTAASCEGYDFLGWTPEEIAVGTTGDLTVVGAFEKQAEPSEWPDPATVVGQDAKAVFTDLPSEFAGADASLVAAWARGNGSLAFKSMADAKIDAFLLDMANDSTAEEIAAEKAKFVITSIDKKDGEWVITVVDKAIGAEYKNGKIKLNAYDSPKGGSPIDPVVGDETQVFWKAELVNRMVD